MWSEAWEAIEDLPAEDRASPQVLRVRLAGCPHLGGWEIGESVAKFLADGDDLSREAAAEFYHQLARKLVMEGQRNAAAEAIRMITEIWPTRRLAVLEDPILGKEFF